MSSSPRHPRDDASILRISCDRVDNSRAGRLGLGLASISLAALFAIERAAVLFSGGTPGENELRYVLHGIDPRCLMVSYEIRRVASMTGAVLVSAQQSTRGTRSDARIAAGRSGRRRTAHLDDLW
jgi:hypothetical protein